MNQATSDHHGANSAQPTKHKSVWLAVVLNCLLPGLGLAYLGRWTWALVNFLLVQLLVVGCVWIGGKYEPSIVEHIHWVVMVLMVGSGSLAHRFALAQS